ncbi:hypothetical protein ACHAC9_11245 [Massilia sp. CMS3.1]|uniref:hypothetical protein n=1 Tax=Massilia sp. CMS3.1 TaxID=3373083 RepID=UPI003EE5D7F3
MYKIVGIAALAISLSPNVFGAGFSEVPTAWKLESYGATVVVLWHTPSTCANGGLGLPGGSTVAEHNRLYATVMTAKTAKIPMFIYYEQRDAQCIITSFGLN